MAANHLLKITRAATSGKKLSSEDRALELEEEQSKVVATQTELNQTNNALDTKEAELVNESRSNRALSQKNALLTSDQSLNQRFEDARSRFNSDEAEVYKQGDKLVIRLKGLEFPTAKSTLKSSNFPLLGKVQQVIKDFGQSAVVIEGHTDSTGGEIANEKLSISRAEVVRDYLLANKVEGQESLDIQSVGYDYQKPLATNKTSAGRAKNRRVDVVITAANEKSETTQN